MLIVFPAAASYLIAWCESSTLQGGLMKTGPNSQIFGSGVLFHSVAISDGSPRSNRMRKARASVFVAFVGFCSRLVRTGQDKPRNSVCELDLMEVKQKAERDVQQFQ
jgi:hypothetical protein